MAQQVKIATDLSSILKVHVVEKTNSYKLCFDFHIPTVTRTFVCHTHLHTVIHTKKKGLENDKELKCLRTLMLSPAQIGPVT